MPKRTLETWEEPVRGTGAEARSQSHVEQLKTTRRRRILAGAVVFGLGAPFLKARAEAVQDPRKSRPQPGDYFVFLKGPRKDEIIAPKDVPLGGPQVLAYPMDPESKIIRRGSRLNQVALVRFDPTLLAEKTRAVSVEGVVAYSAVCTHQGCPVSMWKKDKATLFCSCHGSQFDPRDGARKIGGPAPRRLAALPLKLENGVLAAAGEFQGRIGFKKKR